MTIAILCQQDELQEGQSKGFQIGDISLFAVKKKGQLHLYKNSCPHLGVELEWLKDQFLNIDESLIQCSTHGALFVIESGECVAGPCQGKHLQSVSFSINTKGQLEVLL